jgi:2-polyprenyl-3-methyl-5-hydroxy-6-metoxy-1,4-benzoquinol methylase
MEPSSRDANYAARLRRLEGAWWKRLLDVQRPYRAHLRRLDLGFMLDVGCGIGRNLVNAGGRGVGVDPNAEAIHACRERGLEALTTDEFAASTHARPERFDSLLFSHVLEHMPAAEALALVTTYLPYLRPGGRAVMITPQEAGYRSDPTHVEFVDLEKLDQLGARAGLSRVAAYSFPFPRLVGRWFKYNEFVYIARKD